MARGAQAPLDGLWRPPKQTAENTQEQRDRKRQRRQDEIDRIPIEAKFGQGKRRFSLDRIMTKLPETSETAMATIFIERALPE